MLAPHWTSLLFEWMRISSVGFPWTPAKMSSKTKQFRVSQNLWNDYVFGQHSHIFNLHNERKNCCSCLWKNKKGSNKNYATGRLERYQCDDPPRSVHQSIISSGNGLFNLKEKTPISSAFRSITFQAWLSLVLRIDRSKISRAAEIFYLWQNPNRKATKEPSFNDWVRIKSHFIPNKFKSTELHQSQS